MFQFLSPRLCVPGSPDTRVSMGRCTITKQSTQPNLILVTITKLLSTVGDNYGQGEVFVWFTVEQVSLLNS